MIVTCQLELGKKQNVGRACLAVPSPPPGRSDYQTDGSLAFLPRACWPERQDAGEIRRRSIRRVFSLAFLGIVAFPIITRPAAFRIVTLNIDIHSCRLFSSNPSASTPPDDGPVFSSLAPARVLDPIMALHGVHKSDPPANDADPGAASPSDDANPADGVDPGGSSNRSGPASSANSATPADNANPDDADPDGSSGTGDDSDPPRQFCLEHLHTSSAVVKRMNPGKEPTDHGGRKRDGPKYKFLTNMSTVAKIRIRYKKPTAEAPLFTREILEYLAEVFADWESGRRMRSVVLTDFAEQTFQIPCQMGEVSNILDDIAPAVATERDPITGRYIKLSPH